MHDNLAQKANIYAIRKRPQNLFKKTIQREAPPFKDHPWKISQHKLVCLVRMMTESRFGVDLAAVLPYLTCRSWTLCESTWTRCWKGIKNCQSLTTGQVRTYVYLQLQLLGEDGGESRRHGFESLKLILMICIWKNFWPCCDFWWKERAFARNSGFVSLWEFLSEVISGQQIQALQHLASNGLKAFSLWKFTPTKWFGLWSQLCSCVGEQTPTGRSLKRHEHCGATIRNG